MGSDHSSFAFAGRRDCLLPRKDNVYDESIFHNSKYALGANYLSANGLLVEYPLTMRTNADFAIDFVWTDAYRV
jgi:hypothetical protein